MKFLIISILAFCLFAEIVMGNGRGMNMGPPPTDTKYYNCNDRNPCRSGMTGPQFYFNYDFPSSFVQCSEWGQCYVMPCPQGLVFNVITKVCVYPGK